MPQAIYCAWSSVFVCVSSSSGIELLSNTALQRTADHSRLVTHQVPISNLLCVLGKGFVFELEPENQLSENIDVVWSLRIHCLDRCVFWLCENR